MATAAPIYEERTVSIGRVFQRALSAIALNPIVILALALVVGALPSLLVTYIFAEAGLSSQGTLQSGFSFTHLIGAAFLSAVVSVVVSAFVQGALTRATVSANEGRRATFAESFSAALGVLLPLIGLSLLFGIAVAIGFVLLIVPGVILLLMWAVAVPALVVERHGIMTAFARSAELTKGARWKILGLFLVVILAYWLLSVILGFVGLTVYSASSLSLTTGNLLGSIIIGTVFNALWGTIQPSLYVELRQSKEGVENLEQVFA
jgi:hypothetical protein